MSIKSYVSSALAAASVALTGCTTTRTGIQTSYQPKAPVALEEVLATPTPAQIANTNLQTPAIYLPNANGSYARLRDSDYASFLQSASEVGANTYKVSVGSSTYILHFAGKKDLQVEQKTGRKPTEKTTELYVRVVPGESEVPAYTATEKQKIPGVVTQAALNGLASATYAGTPGFVTAGALTLTLEQLARHGTKNPQMSVEKIQSPSDVTELKYALAPGLAYVVSLHPDGVFALGIPNSALAQKYIEQNISAQADGSLKIKSDANSLSIIQPLLALGSARAGYKHNDKQTPSGIDGGQIGGPGGKQ
jgi:hypothetical protein